MVARGTRRLLGGQAPGAFLARHWHKEPLLVRDAIPGFAGCITRNELFALAGRRDVSARLVRRAGARYTLEHGPFRAAALARLPRRNWTLLVQGVNLHSDAADKLLRHFAFIPHARLDDVMVSYATPGGGVGPHADSYDVFLLQGAGTRRWRYGRQSDLTFRTDAPLRILRHFDPQHDATLESGDLLYLPPDVAHDGTAVGECMTYSIGFRAPLFQELAEAFLDHVRDTIAIPGRYADPDLRPTRAPGRIDPRLQRRVGKVVAQIRWDAAAGARFIGRYLTEPKPDVVFTLPSRPSRAAFERRLRLRGVRLDRRTQLLYDGSRYYLNGDDAPLPERDRRMLQRLADRRRLTPGECASLAPETFDLLYDWHRDGFLADTA
jgi:50S ribosomal protein L16 3-hydroxylase